MLLVFYDYLGLRASKSTSIRLLMVNCIVKQSIDILCNMLEKVASFIVSVDFIILHCEVDFHVSIILGRLFLATGRVTVVMELG